VSAADIDKALYYDDVDLLHYLLRLKLVRADDALRLPKTNQKFKCALYLEEFMGGVGGSIIYRHDMGDGGVVLFCAEFQRRIGFRSKKKKLGR
jgi:hypothetical protein